MKANEYESRPFEVFDRKWALVTAGKIDSFNTMTVSWGAMGTLWNKPVVIVFIKPVRYTSEFMTSSEFFTVSQYDEKYRDVLLLLGSMSGRDTDKIERSGLTPVRAGNSVTFAEAERTFVLRKIYASPFVADKVPEFAAGFYEDEAEHIVFIGEVIDIIEGEGNEKS